MQLLSNRVLVQVLDKEELTSGGIISPKIFNNTATVKAKVIMLGEESMYGEWWLSVGDIVNMDNPRFAKSPMHEIEYEEGKCLIINENDINHSI